MAKKGGKNKNNQSEKQIRSTKKDGLHVMDKLQFQNRQQEKIYNNLAIIFVTRHLPKIMNIVPKEVREERGQTYNTPGKLYKDTLDTIETKKTYVKRFKTFLKYQVIHNGVKNFSDIDAEKTESFFREIAENIGTGKAEYSKKTYDSYVDGYFKGMQALTTKPEAAKVKLDSREYGNAVTSLESIAKSEFRDDIRNQIDEWSSDEYKRGTGYTVRDANVIMKQAEKYMSKEEQLLVATYVYCGARNEEARGVSLDSYNEERGRLELLKPGQTKQDRGRVVLDVPDKVFRLADEVRNEYGYDEKHDLFSKYSSDDVRHLIKECCRTGKIKYSGVHDLRKSYLERIERDAFKQILSGKLTKADLIEKVMEQVSANPKLNPIIEPKIWKYRMVNGEKKWYPVNDPNGVREAKFSYEKLESMNIENILDLYVAEQIGHSKTETNNEYRSEEAKQARREFRETVRTMRKKGHKF